MNQLTLQPNTATIDLLGVGGGAIAPCASYGFQRGDWARGERLPTKQ